MKRIFVLIMLSVFLYSCQSRIVSQAKPIQNNSLELYKKYTIMTNDAKIYNVEVLRQDNEQIFTKNKKGEEIVINKNEIREVKKLDLFASIAIAAAALAAVIIIPL